LCRLGGISLVGYKALSAMQSSYCTRIIISTDSNEIREEAGQFGVEAPFIRPSELATDTASTMDVVDHAMQWVERNTSECYDAVMLLEPSSPFTRTDDYNSAVEILKKKNANAVVAVRPAEVSSTYLGPLDAEGRICSIIDKMHQVSALRRQDMEREYTPSGALYLFRWEYFRRYKDIYHDREGTFGYLMESPYWLEIDEPIDLQWAEFLIDRGYIDLSHWHQT
jgi:CMP-N,N'-diacetyllegionaminic acid synthase